MKDIKGYEGLYAITEDGNVWSYRRNKFLKHTLNNSGYYMIDLYKDKKRKKYLIHRLVCETYIPNPDNLPQVNHKDENKQNNCVSNLEWMSRIDNMNYGTGIERSAKKRSKPVYCVELDKTFKSIRQAAKELGLSDRHICECCKGKRKTEGGFYFRYKEVA